MSKDWTGNYASLYRIMGASNHSETEREKGELTYKRKVTI